MKLQFLGVGGAFAPISVGNSNMLITSDTNKKFLIDFGSTAPYIFRDELKFDAKDIDALWISHLHADHIGGMEWLAFSRFFLPRLNQNNEKILPKLYMIPNLMKELWESSLKGGLESIEGKVMHLTDYFECLPVSENTSFTWEGIRFIPVQTIHIMSGYMFKHSYGLLIETESKRKVFITTDTQFSPYQLRAFYNQADIIFHDCETLPFKSHVHAHYEDLKTLEGTTRNKMYLYHHSKEIESVKEDGFLGFVKKKEVFDL